MPENKWDKYLEKQEPSVSKWDKYIVEESDKKKAFTKDSIPTQEISDEILATGFVSPSSVPSSATLSPLEIPRPQGQSEKIRVEAGATKPLPDPNKLGSFLPQDKTVTPKTDLAGAITPAKKTAALVEERPLIKQRQEQAKQSAFENTLKAYKNKFKASETQVESERKKLEKMLNDGDLQIAKDPNTGQRILAYKNENFFSSLWDSAKRVESVRQDNKRFSDLSLDDKIKYAEEEINKGEEYLPELPSGVMGSLGEYIAGATTPLVRPIMYGMATAAGAAMLNAPAAAAAGAQTVGSSIAFIEDMMYGNRAETFKRVYAGKLKDIPSPTEQQKRQAALEADQAAVAASAVGALEATAFSIPFGKLAKMEQSAGGYLDLVEKTAKHTMSEAPKAATIMGAGAAARGIISKEAGADLTYTDIANESLEAAKSGAELVGALGVGKMAMAALPHAMTVVAGLVRTPSKAVDSKAKAIVSELPREEVLTVYRQGEESGVYPKGTTEKVAETLKQYDEAKAAVPETIEKTDTVDALTGKLEAKFKKQRELEETKVEARKKEIQSEIEALDKDIDAIYEGKPVEQHEYDITGKKISELKPVIAEEKVIEETPLTEEQLKGEVESESLQKVAETDTVRKESIEKMTDADIENRMSEIEGGNFNFDAPERKEYYELEREMEKRERATVFNVPLEKVSDAVDALIKKEKERPNGYGSFIEMRDAREIKEVANKYLNPSKITDAELESDFSDAVRGNPTTWYADGLKLRESLKEATSRGIDTEKMLEAVTKIYTDAGYDIKTAKSVVANMLKPVFEGSQKVETDKSRIIEQPTPAIQKETTTISETRPELEVKEKGLVELPKDVSEFEKTGIEILNKYGVKRFKDWVINQPLLGGFNGLRDIANKYGFKFPQTEKEFNAEVKKVGDIDKYMELKFGDFFSNMKKFGYDENADLAREYKAWESEVKQLKSKKENITQKDINDAAKKAGYKIIKEGDTIYGKPVSKDKVGKYKKDLGYKVIIKTGEEIVIDAIDNKIKSLKEPPKPKQDVSKDIKGVSGEVRERQEPVKTKPIQETSGEKNSPSGDVQGNAKEKVREPNSINNRKPFTTKSGRQTVEYDEKGDLIVKDKDGKEVSEKTRKKAIQEYAENFDYTVGEKAPEPTDIRFTSEEEAKRYVVENSNNPYELAELYANEEPITAALSSKDRMIAEYGIGKVKGDSYNEFGDRNNMNLSKAKTYISKDGRSLDVIAKEMSDHYGFEILPSDLVDFMDRFPSGERQALRLVETDISLEAANKFKKLTGINLNKEIAEKVVEQQFKKLTKEQQLIAEQDYETAKQLEAEYWKNYKETDGFTKEIPVGEAKPAEPAKKVKEGSLGELFSSLPKSEKLRERELSKIIDANFEEIVNKLVKENKADKKCN